MSEMGAGNNDLGQDGAQGANAAGVRFVRVCYSEEEKRAFRDAALVNALRFGMTKEQWERHRLIGNPISNDMLMAYAPRTTLAAIGWDAGLAEQPADG